MSFLLDKKSLLEKLQIADFVLKTQHQIIKDFSTVSISFDPSFSEKELEYDDLVSVLSKKIIELLDLGESTLLQLMYQIDLPQDQFLAITSDPHFAEKLAELIIRREAYKVYLRSKF